MGIDKEEIKKIVLNQVLSYWEKLQFLRRLQSHLEELIQNLN